MSAPQVGYRKVGRVLFVCLRRCNITRWSNEARLSAYQLGLTRIGKTVVVPDLPQNRDLLLKIYPWISVDAKTTDECRAMLKVPEGISWQELRDNIPEPELPYTEIGNVTVKRRDNFLRELQWLKEEMRERLGVEYVKPMDALDPSEPASTLFLFDNATKEYWKIFTKEKMKADRRFARFTPTPKNGFNSPTTTEAMGIFFPKMGRGDYGFTLHNRGVPMHGTPASSRWHRHKRTNAPLIKIQSGTADTIVAGLGKGSPLAPPCGWCMIAPGPAQGIQLVDMPTDSPTDALSPGLGESPEMKEANRLSRAMSDGVASVDLAQLTDDQREMYLALMRDGASSQAASQSPSRTIFNDVSSIVNRESARRVLKCLRISVAPGWHRSLLITFFAILPEIGAFTYALARESYVIAIPTATLTLLSLLFLAACVLTEPGVLPRGIGTRPLANRGITQWGVTCLREYDKLTDVNGQELVRRWCSTCEVLRPPRASHCSVCNVCVNVFDHHCVVIGACIGERNFKHFSGFLWTSTLLAVWVAAVCVTCIAAPDFLYTKVMLRGDDFSISDPADIVVRVLIGYCAIVLCMLLPFATMYLKLTCAGMTQRESEKRRYLFPARESPFAGSCCDNASNMLCSSVPSALDRVGEAGSLVHDPWANQFPVREPDPDASLSSPGATRARKERIKAFQSDVETPPPPVSVHIATPEIVTPVSVAVLPE